MSYSASAEARSGEQIAAVGDLELCYETFGDRSDPALVLIMGLATQMIAWREEFCERLAAAGFFVVRFDNRDVGRSTTLDDLPVPTTWQLLRRDKRAASYTLEDMALDVVGLLDHLEIERAHVVGASMGAMIAQTVAINHPDRVRSLVSIMGSTGARTSGQPQLRTAKVLLSVPPADRDGFVEHMVKTFTVIGSPGFERDEDELRRFAEATFDRGRNPAAGARQLAAIIASGNRTPPAAPDHRSRRSSSTARADTLVRPSGGRATARAIPGSTLLEIPGMGHDLPPEAWPQIVDAIAENAAREDASMNRPPSIGETIRKQRELNQVSMRQFADMAGISNPYLSQIERGLREPSERVLEAIAESLETSADALYEQAGIVVEDGSETAAARAAIEADPALTPRQRRTLLDVYDALLAAGPRPARAAPPPAADIRP